MRPRLDEPQACSDWRWLGQRIRCALAPDDPRLLTRFLNDGHELVVHHDLPAWRIFEGSFQLLLDSATDRALPWHWRCLWHAIRCDASACSGCSGAWRPCAWRHP